MRDINSVPAPADIDLRYVDVDLTALAQSHGWRTLAPFHWSDSTAHLATAAEIAGRPVAIDLRQAESSVVASFWGLRDVDQADRVARRILNRDLDLSGFHSACRRRARYRHLAESGAGALLRCPSIWEDLVKVLATTNVSWSGTRSMTEKLLISLGQPSPLGRRTFPGPDRIAAIEVDALAAMSGFGYRAKSLQAIAAMVCDGEIDPQSWADTARSDRSVSAEIGELPGIGPYARSCILALCGRFGELPIDSVFRARHKDSERAIRHYARWGRWKYLAYWFGSKS